MQQNGDRDRALNNHIHHNYSQNKHEAPNVSKRMHSAAGRVQQQKSKTGRQHRQVKDKACSKDHNPAEQQADAREPEARRGEGKKESGE
jgi:hypothetical protein